MSDDSESFLRRWSRRKHATSRPAPSRAPDPPPPDLPPVEGLGAASDYTPFLQRGVAAEVQRVALDRAWTTDAQIAGFRGMGEYDWDFNAPAYGQLAPGDDVAKLIRSVLAPPEPDPTPEPEPAAAPELASQKPPEAEAEAGPEPPPPVPKSHGSARPV